MTLRILNLSPTLKLFYSIEILDYGLWPHLLKFCHKESGEEVSRVGTPWEGGKGGEKTSKVGSLLEFREYNPLWLSRGEGFSFIRSLSGAV